jgi:cytochrome bd-type quinol oxidase subunit 2
VNKTLGLGRLLVAVYGVFALSASARASFQLFTKFDEAPLAYSLSALSAFVYIIATIALARGEQSRGLALATVGFELVGVISVGALSLLLPELFAHPSVWSGFGSGYAFIPLLLPILGLIWLRRERARNN